MHDRKAEDGPFSGHRGPCPQMTIASPIGTKLPNPSDRIGYRLEREIVARKRAILCRQRRGVLQSNSTNHSKKTTGTQSRNNKYFVLIGPAGLEPATLCLEVPLEFKPDKAFSDLECAGVRKIPQENGDSAPWAHPDMTEK